MITQERRYYKPGDFASTWSRATAESWAARSHAPEVQRYAGQVEMDQTARDIAHDDDEAELAGKAWARHKEAEIHARLALRWQQIAADDQWMAANRAGQSDILPATASGIGAPPQIPVEELEEKARRSAEIAELHAKAAEECGKEGDELAEECAKKHQANGQKTPTTSETDVVRATAGTPPRETRAERPSRG